MNKEELFKKIEMALFHESLDRDDEEKIIEEIEEAKEEGYFNYIKFQLLYLEKVKIEWNDKDEYTVTNVSNRDRDEILKLYAIADATSESIYAILNRGKKYIDTFVWYDKLSKEEIIQEWIDNGAEVSRESLLKDFEECVCLTSLGYVEQR